MTISITKPTVSGSENTWGATINTALDDVVAVLNGTTASTPDLTAGSWKVGGVAVTSTAAELNILNGVGATTAELNLLDGVLATTTELNYVDGVTSNIQTQIDAKSPVASPTFTGTVTVPVVAVSGGTQNWTIDEDSNELFFKYGGASKAKIPDGNSVVGYLGEQSTSTWTTGTGTTESLISPAKLKGTIDSQLNVSGSAPIYGVRAWANFNGQGSNGANQTLNGSGNIASVYKTGTGNFTLTFTTAMPDANYSITFGAGNSTSVSDGNGLCMDVYSQSASAFSMAITDPTDNNLSNPLRCYITIVR